MNQDIDKLLLILIITKSKPNPNLTQDYTKQNINFTSYPLYNYYYYLNASSLVTPFCRQSIIATIDRRYSIRCETETSISSGVVPIASPAAIWP